MRSIVTAVFAAALIAAPVQSKAAPRSIGDCEKIQAADAYNQCLALFGPPARGFGAAGSRIYADRQDAETTPRDAHAEVVKVTDSHHGRRHASRQGGTRHGWARHGLAGHGHWHRTGAAGHRHGKTTSVAFSVVSGHTRLR